MKKILPADTLTPILAYMRVQGDHKVILESIPREKENARFSIVAYNPVFEVVYQDEAMSSFEASEIYAESRRDGRLDSIAAMIILRRYLGL